MPATTLDRYLPSLPTSAAALNLRWPRWLPAALLAAMLVLLLRLLPGHDPQLSRLQIDGSFDRVTPEAVRAAAMTHLGQGFFSVDLDAVHDDVAALPWVQRVRVERVWPVGIRVRIWERTAAARWNDDGLLDTSASVFRPAAEDLSDSALALLPKLEGTAGNEVQVARTWNELSQALQDTSLALSALRLDARGEWTAQTRRGVELRFGPGVASQKLGVLKTALPAALGERLSEVAYVDLRYTNGFAIGWLVPDKTIVSVGGAPRSATAAVTPTHNSANAVVTPAASSGGQQRGSKNG